MRKLRIGMIGYGGIGRIHALAYRALTFQHGLPADTLQIAGVATTSAASAERAAREIGCEVWTDSYQELLARPDIDVVDICVPNDRHAEIALAAAAAGKHIYCEKPLSLDVGGGRAMVAAAAAAGVATQLCFNFRYIPAIMRARQLIDEGFLGRVFSFRGCFYRSSYISADKPLSWRLRREVAGGGALVDLGSHLLDLVYYLLGDFGSVQATLETLIKERPLAAGSPERAPVDVDDLALLQLRMAGGALGSLEVSRMGTGATNDLAITIYGERGALRFGSEDPSWLELFDVRDPDQPQGGVSGFRKVQTVGRYPGQKVPDWSMAPGFVGTFVESARSFLEAVSDGRPGSPSFADGLRVQEAMAAAARSAEQGGWAEI